MAIIYHYCAMRESKPGVLSYGHGMITTSFPISTPEQYAETTEKIAKSRGWDVTETVILSVSRLGGSSDNGT